MSTSTKKGVKPAPANTANVATSAPVAVAPAPAPVAVPVPGSMPESVRYVGIMTAPNGYKLHVYEDVDGNMTFSPVVKELSPLEQLQAELTEKARKENAELMNTYKENAKLSGLSYVVSRPNCMKVTYTAVETVNSPDGLRIKENRQLSRFVKFSDVWDVADSIMAPVMQACYLLPTVDSTTSVKKAVWPLAKACGRAVPAERLLQLLTSLREYRQNKVKGVKKNSYSNELKNMEVTLIQFLNTCPVAPAPAPENK